jgi:hypothetical protein
MCGAAPPPFGCRHVYTRCHVRSSPATVWLQARLYTMPCAEQPRHRLAAGMFIHDATCGTAPPSLAAGPVYRRGHMRRSPAILQKLAVRAGGVDLTACMHSRWSNLSSTDDPSLRLGGVRDTCPLTGSSPPTPRLHLPNQCAVRRNARSLCYSVRVSAFGSTCSEVVSDVLIAYGV